MKIPFTKVLGTLAVAGALTTACGGGDNESAGSVTAFSVSPSSITWTGSPGSCASFSPSGLLVYVYGGAAPYRLNNANPSGVELRSNLDPDPNVLEPITDTVAAPGGSFEVIFTGVVCVKPGTVTVVDQTGKVVTLTLTSVAGT